MEVSFTNEIINDIWCRIIGKVDNFMAREYNKSKRNRNLTKECNCMKGIKIGIVGVCVSLVGIAFAMNNFIAISAAFVGLLLSIVGCFIKDK